MPSLVMLANDKREVKPESLTKLDKVLQTFEHVRARSLDQAAGTVR